MKKNLFLFILMLLPLVASAAVEINGIYYNLNSSEKTAEVTRNPNNYQGSVVIPETVTYSETTYSVTSIGYMAFSNCYVTNVTIPNSVTSIGDYAFQYCYYITSVTIPNSVTSIGKDTFRNCSGLTSVTIGNSVTSIGDETFINCSGLASVTIPNSVTSIGYGAFYGTAWYNNQPDGLVYAGKVAYKYKGTMPSNTSIVLQEGTLGITDYAFSDCSGLTSVTISNSVTSIGDYVFSSCSGLMCVTIPNSVTNIGYRTFYNCSALMSVNIPNSVTSIGTEAFEGTAWYNNQPDGLVYAGKVAYRYKGTMPLNTSIVMQEGTLGITASAFYGCSGLTSVTIPNSVTSIGDYAFSTCSGLTSVTIPNSVTSIGNSTFEYCFGLMSVNIPNSVTSIGDLAFGSCSVTSVNIPNSVTSIGNKAFYNCSALTSVIIGNSVTSIGEDAFRECSSLTSVTVKNEIPVAIKNYSTFTNKTNATLYVPCGSKPAYEAANYWKEFKEIIEIEGIAINEVNFPDENFRNWLLQQSYGQDDVLTDSEINEITVIDVSGTYDTPNKIKSLKGIKYFTALTTLSCSSNHLTSLDVSKNTVLENLYCSSNQLTSLDVSKNTVLTRLWCNANQLTSLDVSECTALTYLFCRDNQLTSLDVSGCMALTRLECYSNQLTSLDVSKNTALTMLFCNENQLTSLDMLKNAALTYLSCDDNQLTSLDVSGCMALKQLMCYSNQLTSLDVSGCTALTWLNCGRNKIKGRNMSYLIKSLPKNDSSDTHGFYVIDNSEGDEGNVCTKSQVAAVKAKGWRPYYYEVTEERWKGYEGSEDVISDTDLSQLDNTVYINNVEVLADTETTLGIRMKNTAAIRGFQFDLYLPEGVTIVKSSKGKIQAALNKNRLEADDEHTLSCNEQKDGSIRVLCGSQYEETFTGNDGEVLTLQIAVSKDMVEDDYPVYLKNIKLSENNITNYYEIEQVKSTLTVSSYIPGDINGDGKVDVSDYIGVANYILNIPQDGFNEKAGDVDGSGSIDVSDYLGIGNIIHTGSPFGNGASRAADSRRR